MRRGFLTGWVSFLPRRCDYVSEPICRRTGPHVYLVGSRSGQHGWRFETPRHSDADHIRGLIRIVEEFAPTAVWVNGETRDTDVAQEFDAAVATSGAEVRIGRRGDTTTVGDVSLDVFHPTALGPDSNDNSIVLRLDHAGASALFMGDLEADGEAELLASGLDLDIDFLKVGHHGSRTSTTEAFLAATTPALAAYSALAGNQFDHPHAETLARLAAAGVETIGTRDLGTLVLEPVGGTWRLQGAPEEPITLSAPWSFVTATESGPPEVVFGDITELDAVFRWNAGRGEFDTWRRGVPAVLNSLDLVEPGDALWLLLSASATWMRSDFSDARSVTIASGWSTIGWTGPDTPASDVVALLRAERIVGFSSPNQTFESFDPDQPAFLNALDGVLHGQALWVLSVGSRTVDLPTATPPHRRSLSLSRSPRPIRLRSPSLSHHRRNRSPTRPLRKTNAIPRTRRCAFHHRRRTSTAGTSPSRTSSCCNPIRIGSTETKTALGARRRSRGWLDG
jgi:hypothetical protein